MSEFSEYKCKSCGASLSFTPGESVVTCAYCGLKQDAPNIVSEDSKVYKEALDLYYKGKYEASKDLFSALGSYEDSENFYIRCEEAIRQKQLNKKKKIKAIVIFALIATAVLSFAIWTVAKSGSPANNEEYGFKKIKNSQKREENVTVTISQCTDEISSVEANHLDYKNHSYLAYQFGNKGQIYLLLSDEDLSVSKYFRIAGTYIGNFVYESVDGRKITAKVIEVKSCKLQSYEEAAHPLIRTVEVNEKTGMNGYDITVEKVEFAEGQTRVYIRMENNGEEAITLSSGKKYSNIVQNQQQYGITDMPGGFQSLIPGCYYEGFLCFNQIEEAPFMLQLQHNKVVYTFDIDERYFTKKD